MGARRAVVGTGAKAKHGDAAYVSPAFCTPLAQPWFRRDGLSISIRSSIVRTDAERMTQASEGPWGRARARPRASGRRKAASDPADRRARAAVGPHRERMSLSQMDNPFGEKHVPGVDLAPLLSSSRRRPTVLSDWRPTATPAGVGASHDGVGLLSPALLLCQELGRQARADRRSGEDEEGRYRQTAASRRSASAATDLSRARI